MDQHNLSDRKKLFEEQLPRWESIISYLAFNLLQTRTIDRGLMGAKDVQQRLRIALWRAVEQYEEDKGAKLNTWITNILKQECSLIVEAHYNKLPRSYATCAVCELGEEPKVVRKKDLTRHIEQEHEMSVREYRELYPDSSVEGNPMPLMRLQTVPLWEDEEQDKSIVVEDPTAAAAFDMIAETDWFKRDVRLIFKVLQKKKSINEKQAFAMILSGKYASDREIADRLKVNFAKVGEVRFKAKLVFALLEGIPIETFTNAQNAEKLAKRLRHLLRPYVTSFPIEEPSGA